MPIYIKSPDREIYDLIKRYFPKSSAGKFLKQFKIPNRKYVLLELQKIISGKEALYNSSDDIAKAVKYETVLLNLK